MTSIASMRTSSLDSLEVRRFRTSCPKRKERKASWPICFQSAKYLKRAGLKAKHASYQAEAYIVMAYIVMVNA